MNVYSTCALIEKTAHQYEYPIGILLNPDLGDIEIHFMHYDTFAVAKSKWEKRSKMIYYDNIYVMMDMETKTSQELLNEFETIKYKNKVALTNRKYDNTHSLKMGVYDENYYPGKLYTYKKRFGVKIFLDEFDYVSFLNTGEIKRINR